MKQNFQLMSNYNKNMNNNLIKVCDGVTENELYDETGAFFGSIFKTFNHIILGDLIWLSRIAMHDSCFAAIQKYLDFEFEGLNDQVCADYKEFKSKRIEVDQDLEALGEEVTDADLLKNLKFMSTTGKMYEKPLWIYTTHLFNHQTHHRGQITTLLSQKGYNPGVTDLPAVISRLP